MLHCGLTHKALDTSGERNNVINQGKGSVMLTYTRINCHLLTKKYFHFVNAFHDLVG